MNDKDLQRIFNEMRHVADLNQQPVPFNYFLKEEGEVWAEIPGGNPIPMAFLNEKKQWQKVW